MTIARPLLSALLLAAAAADSRGADDLNWPEFRGPRGDGSTTSTGLPVTWSETNHVKWKTDLHGKAWSSPVIWGNQIWLTTASPDGHERFVLCVDRDTGQVVRDQKLYDVPNPQFAHQFNSHASPTPASHPPARPAQTASFVRSCALVWHKVPTPYAGSC